MTDERLGHRPGDPLWTAIGRLPRGGGIVFRHYGLAEPERRVLLKQMERVAKRRGLVVVGSGISGTPDGVHRPGWAPMARGRGLVTASAHGRRELVQAFARGAHLVFLSPVFATRSHPGGRVLGPVRFGLAAQGGRGPVIALGGMTAARGRRMTALGAFGYAGIDCWV
jgi:thiamine-phosphate pyrophosphorylase